MSEKYRSKSTDVEVIRICEENLAELRELAEKHNFEVETGVTLQFYGNINEFARTMYDGNYLVLHPGKQPEMYKPTDLELNYDRIPVLPKASLGMLPYNFQYHDRESAMRALHERSSTSQDWLNSYNNHDYDASKEQGYIHFVELRYPSHGIDKREYHARNRFNGGLRWLDITPWINANPDRLVSRDSYGRPAP